MTESIDNNFTLRFYGDGVSPESFSARELGQLLIHIEDSVASIVDSRYPESDRQDVRVSLLDIENKSESLHLTAFGDENAPKAFLEWGKALDDNTYTDLPEAAYNGHKFILGLIQKKNCRVQLYNAKNRIYDIEPEFKLIKLDSVVAFVDTTIYGELKKIGGEKPRVWVKLDSGKVVAFYITSEQAKELSTSLYQSVALKGSAKWNAATQSIVGFKLYEILSYKAGNVVNAFRELRKLSSGTWSQFNNNEEITRYLRKD